MISLVIPSYNNLRHLKNAYNSVRKHYTDKVELILIDDGSDDDEECSRRGWVDATPRD